MFPFPIARPQGCDIQTFYGNKSLTGKSSFYSWNKPVGVSHVYMMLIGAGGDGDSTNGGGTGAVTVWYGAAQHVPNNLTITLAGATGANTTIGFRNGTSEFTLLQADDGIAATSAAAFTGNQFTAMGFFKSVDGQAGTSGANQSASTNTFLSGGTDATSRSVTANYGYALSTATTNRNGTFLMQPIIVGIGAKSDGTGGVGCGGGFSGKGGAGMVLIASW